MRGTLLVTMVMAAAVPALVAGTQVPAQQPTPGTAVMRALTPPRHLPAPAENAPALPAMVFDATRLGSPITLDRDWRIGVTANADAANPGFDDSKWPLHNTHDLLDNLDDLDRPPETANGTHGGEKPPSGERSRHGRPFVWFRMHIRLAPHHGPVALLISMPVSQSTAMVGAGGGPGVDVFANGQEIAPEGPNGNAAGRYQEISRIYDLGVAPDETSLTLVVRTIYIPFGLASYTSFFTFHTLRIGNPADLRNELELWSVHNLFERLPRLIIGILLLVLSVFLLALYFSQRGHLEYLWLALHELVQAPIGFIDQAGSSAHLDQIWYGALVLQLLVVSAYLYFEFLVAFLGMRRRWYIVALRYSAPILAGVGPVLGLLGTHNPVLLVCMVVVLVGGILWIVGLFSFIFITLIAATLRRNYEAGLLLVSLLLMLVGVIEPILTGSMSKWGGQAYKSPLTVQAGPIPIHFASIADFIGLLAIVLIIFVRFLRIHYAEERASSELAAARSVQELIIPEQKLETPGYEVDSVYTPAQEVGGDFFFVQPMGNDELLVAIGDVAGKGMKAAMSVSMLVGALRQMTERNPARILELLNRVVAGSEGLTTCQVALFDGKGGLVMANAGHLPPYLNSQEIAVPGSLPLGAIANVTYDEVRLYLHPGDRILMLSDGVLEARKATGELFGFNRIHNLSNQSAFYIADAAKAFGQEDDITVLTVRRMPSAAA